MAIYATNSRYDSILLHWQRQRDAADLREARSEARRVAAQNMLFKSDGLRNTLADSIAQSRVDQSQADLLTHSRENGR
ncbi:MAG: hypothetical protein MO846_07905 [Candidatus Devosia symbiotica]|nr:hypothetical protein [Candidatus Devosia symbiotica]